MQHNLSGLAVSLFSLQSSWGIICNEGIKPFLKVNESLLKGYHLQFNIQGGQNIRFSLFCDGSSSRLLAKKVNHFFNDFFKKGQFPVAEIRLPAQGLFMPFPDNTVQYGLYHAGIYTVNDYSSTISNIILDYLADSEFCNEDAFTYAYYLYLAVFRVTRFSNYDRLFLYFKEPAMPEDTLHSKYITNKLALNEIYNSVAYVDRNLLKLNDAWLEEWMRLCEDDLQNLSEDLVFSRIAYILDIIDKHLNLNLQTRSLLIYFIKQCFDEHPERDK